MLHLNLEPGQPVQRLLGKEKVPGSNPGVGSIPMLARPGDAKAGSASILLEWGDPKSRRPTIRRQGWRSVSSSATYSWRDGASSRSVAVTDRKSTRLNS